MVERVLPSKWLMGLDFSIKMSIKVQNKASGDDISVTNAKHMVLTSI